MAARPHPIIRYAVYTRQSVDKGDEFSSCEAQFMTCRDFAAETGEPGLYWISQRFDDEGRSGATPSSNATCAPSWPSPTGADSGGCGGRCRRQPSDETCSLSRQSLRGPLPARWSGVRRPPGCDH